MKLLKLKPLLVTIAVCLIFINAGCNYSGKTGTNQNKTGIINVPSQISSIAEAVKYSKSGDTIIIAPGHYFENNIDIDKAITITSKWNIAADEKVIDKTIINANDSTLFNIIVDGIEISGLKIIHSDHALNILAKTTILYNHFSDCQDALSFESSGGGYAGFNIIENDRDDGIDIDIGSDKNSIGSDITIENNTIINSNDDGIEIRLFSWPNQNITYDIRQNTIIGSNNAAVQLISYDVPTGKQFYIHHNIFRNCKTGLGCMEGSNTRENLGGASKMNEPIYLYNNTLAYNKMGATGGNNIMAFNNIVLKNSLGGFKMFGQNSVVSNNLFYKNGGDSFISFNNSVLKEKNIFSVDPLLDKITFKPMDGSPCIESGIEKFTLKGETIFEIPDKYRTGLKPDIGAVNSVGKNNPSTNKQTLIVDAGKNIVLKSPVNKTELQGKVIVCSDDSINTEWKLVNGTGNVGILNQPENKAEIVFNRKGIYQFAFLCKTGETEAKDIVTVRYIDDGKGVKQFVSKENSYTVNAENYAFSYGNTSVITEKSNLSNKYILINAENFISQPALEYSIGTAENKSCTIRFLVKNQNTADAMFSVKFNNIDSETLKTDGNSDWKWVEVQPEFQITAGRWPLLIIPEKGAILIDKIQFVF